MGKKENACFRCGHLWVQRTIHDTRVCPRCHSAKWKMIRLETEYGRKPNREKIAK